MTIVQGNMLYASELTWNGRKGVGGEQQADINRIDRAGLGAFESTPLGVVVSSREQANPGQSTPHPPPG